MSIVGVLALLYGVVLVGAKHPKAHSVSAAGVIIERCERAVNNGCVVISFSLSFLFSYSSFPLLFLPCKIFLGNILDFVLCGGAHMRGVRTYATCAP